MFYTHHLWNDKSFIGTIISSVQKGKLSLKKMKQLGQTLPSASSSHRCCFFYINPSWTLLCVTEEKVGKGKLQHRTEDSALTPRGGIPSPGEATIGKNRNRGPCIWLFSYRKEMIIREISPCAPQLESLLPGRGTTVLRLWISTDKTENSNSMI